jgi:hypothetical protein
LAAEAEPSKRGRVTEYLIAFDDEWVPDLTDEDLRETSKAVSAEGLAIG